MENVDYQHPDYRKQKYFWGIIDDVMSDDERRMTKYLRTINPADESLENIKLNEEYRRSATWKGVTSTTVEAKIGSIFRKWPTIAIPDGMKYITKDADGEGKSIYQVSQSAAFDTLTKGRSGVYVAFHRTPSGGQISRADMLSGVYVSTIHRICPENIINWRMGQVGSKVILTLVVIEEQESIDSGYGTQIVKRWREMAIEDGVYVERIWRGTDNGPELIDVYEPMDATGATWDRIPFIFIGAEVNDTRMKNPPVWALAKMNLRHYQNSADNEESTFFGVQNQPFINSTELMTRSEIFKEMEDLGIQFGNRRLLPFPVGVASSTENLQVSREMDRKVESMQALGARLSATNQAAKTAAQVHGEREGQTSVMAMIASNVSEAYTQAIKWACLYMGDDPENVEFTLNQDFVNMGMDANILQAIMQGWQMGSIPTDDYVRVMKRMEIFDDARSAADYQEMLSATGGNYGLDA